MLETRLVGNAGPENPSKKEVQVHGFVTAEGKHTGITALTHPFLQTEPSTKFFLNSDFGVAMNQNAAFSGTPERVHNGTDIVLYTASAVSGAKFTFNNTERASEGVITMVDYSALEGGETITVNAQVITEGVEWTAGVDNETTAASIATALNAVTAIGITAQAVTLSGPTAYVVTVSIDGGDNIDMSTNADSGELTIADEKSVKTDDAAVNDVMQFAKGSDLTLANFTAITMKINVDKDWKANDSIEVYGWDTGLGAQVGSRVKLEDYFSFGEFDTWHGLSIPLIAMALESATTVDAFRIEIVSKEGRSPKFYLDRFQVEQTGTPAVFSLNVDLGDRFHIEELIFAYADAIDIQGDTGASVPNLSYDKILGLTELINGFTISRSKKGKTLFSASIKTLGSHISAGAKADLPWSDGTNTFVVLRAVFERPLILTGDVDDSLTITIRDDMTGLLQFTCSARGSLENR